MTAIPLHHDTFDLDLWTTGLLLDAAERPRGTWISSPSELAITEQIRAKAAKTRDLGPAIPADVFVWSIQAVNRSAPLTQLGGTPWRSAAKPWPRGTKDQPLHFIGQISFVDSRDIVPFDLPGDVVQLFATFDDHDVLDWEGLALEWSTLELSDPIKPLDCPLGCRLPFSLRGVIHRTRQYPDAGDVLGELGWRDYNQISMLQATSISTRASLPQGWPFEDGDGNTLLCMWSTLSPTIAWPFVNCDNGPEIIHPKGNRARLDVFDVGIADAGCIYVYRDAAGEFRWEMVGG